MTSLILYTTTGCHLCEHAELILQSARQSGQLRWQAVDIAADEDLVDRYGIRIPVVKRTDNARELGWPFDEQALLKFSA